MAVREAPAVRAAAPGAITVTVDVPLAATLLGDALTITVGLVSADSPTWTSVVAMTIPVPVAAVIFAVPERPSAR